MNHIVRNLEPITLIGAGPLSESVFSEVTALAPTLVAADGGAAHCLGFGHMPVAVIGDMDSLAKGAAKGIPETRLHLVAEQDSTDFDKALRHIAAPLVLAAGFTGGRLDHELACFNGLVRHAERPCILVGEQDVICLAPPTLTLPLAPGTRVSLFPMADVTAQSEGLKWPLDGIAFAPNGRVGTSNEATGTVQVRCDAPAMLLILPRSELALLITQMLETSVGWPAP